MPPQQRGGLLDLLMKRVGLGGHDVVPKQKVKVFWFFFSKKNSASF